MKNKIYPLLFLVSIPLVNAAYAQAAKTQYGFIMVMNKTATKLYYSPVFSFQVDKRGNPVCTMSEIEADYRSKVAGAEWDVMCSDYFDSRQDAEDFRKTYITSEREAGRTVVESTEAVADCR